MARRCARLAWATPRGVLPLGASAIPRAAGPYTELNSSSEMPEKRRHLFRAAQLRIFFDSLCFAALQVRSEKEFDDPNSFSKWYDYRSEGLGFESLRVHTVLRQ